MKFFVVVLAVFAVAAAAPSNKNLLTDIIKALFNNNRDKLANLTIERIALGEEGVNGEVTNLNIQNLENLSIDRLDSDGPLSVSISNGTVSLITGSATAAFNFINVESPELGLLLNGVGDLSGVANGLWATIKLKCKLNGLSLRVEDFSDLQVRVDEIKATLTGIENAEQNNAIINSDLAGFLAANLPRIAEENKVAILEKVNEILSEIS